MKKLLVIGGPTASGKTSLAIDVAEALQTVILSADSRQCYREMRIGTAVPTEAELNRVPHFFIHSHSMHDTLNVGVYEQYALNVLEQAFQKHNVVVCVGGTGLYINAILRGIDTMPETPDSVKQAVQAEFEEKGLLWLQEEVARIDPELYGRVDTMNHARLLRALAFYRAHGSALSAYQKQQRVERPFQTALFCLMPDKKILHDRINLRVDDMMTRGLWEEAQSLYPERALKALQTVGYKELFEVMDGKINLSDAVEQIKTHTRQYAKRQLTWFKHQTQAHFISPELAFPEIMKSV